jgi:hypothetical protein
MLAVGLTHSEVTTKPSKMCKHLHLGVVDWVDRLRDFRRLYCNYFYIIAL